MAEKKKRYRSLKSIPFGGNAMRLSLKELLLTGALTLTLMFWTFPFLYGKYETYNFKDDFRLSYNLRDDYWSYQKWCEYAADKYGVMFVGDSVIWGMYTDDEHTLIAHYNDLKDEDKAANLGIDGLHPVAMEGLVRDFGGAVRGKKVYLFFNALWMNDPKFDLSALPRMDEEGELETISVMHPRLVPQFDTSILSYNETLKKRMANTLERKLPLFSLTNHLRNLYYDNKPLPEWIVENPDQNIFSVVTGMVDAVEHEHINRQDPWNEPREMTVNYDWLMPYQSLQWAAFMRTVEILRERSNSVTVLLGAFNTNMLEEDSLIGYEKLMDYAEEALEKANIDYIRISDLPSETYADGSHPLDPGYMVMAKEIIEKENENNDED